MGLQKLVVFEAARSRSYAKLFWLNNNRRFFNERGEVTPEAARGQAETRRGSRMEDGIWKMGGASQNLGRGAKFGGGRFFPWNIVS